MNLNLNLRLRRFWIVLALAALSVSTIYAQNQNPGEIVAAFLDAWNANDIDRMYSYLSRESRQFYAPEAFRLRYQRVNDVMEFEGVAYTIGQSRVQGVTAAVQYDAKIKAGAFGEIDDPGRTMRLVWDGNVWGVAWSSLDIFAALTAQAEMISSGRLPPRANIYDRNGNPVASQGEVITLYGQKQNMTSQADCEILLAQLTRRPRAAFTTYFGDYSGDTIFFLTELDTTVYYNNQINLDSWCGVFAPYTGTRPTRAYYGGNAVSHVVGWIGQMDAQEQTTYTRRGYSAGDLIGKNAIERAYEEELAGTPERVLRISEPGGTTLREFGSTAGSPPTPLQLTIDRDLQLVTAQAMVDAYDYAINNWGGIAGAGAAVVIDLKENPGAVLALVSYPLVDPLLFDPSSPNPVRGDILAIVNNDGRRPFINHAIADQFNPGSVYKIITMAAVINEGIVQPSDRFNCELRWEGAEYGDGRPFRLDWRATDGFPAAGEISPAEALMASCNPFFWEFGGKLYQQQRRNVIGDYARQMGLGQAYNLFSDNSAVVGNLDNPTEPTVALNNVVGQGSVQLPPIQMAVAVSAVATGGALYRPYLVNSIGGFDGTEIVQQFAPEQVGTLDFKPEVLQTIREGMCGAVSNENLGTAYLVFEDAPYTLCGKTGTAQTGDGVPPNAWFISFAPADDPQIATVVMVSFSREGSEVAAPITRRILDYYFNVPGDQVKVFPEWWLEPYEPLTPPDGGTVG